MYKKPFTLLYPCDVSRFNVFFYCGSGVVFLYVALFASRFSSQSQIQNNWALRNATWKKITQVAQTVLQYARSYVLLLIHAFVSLHFSLYTLTPVVNCAALIDT